MYLQDISIHVPFFFVLIACLMIISMPNKWHYLLLVPLGFCLLGVYRLYRPFNGYYNQTSKMYIEDIVLTVVLATMVVSAGLNANTKDMFQVILRGIVIVLMAFLAFLICFSSPIRSVYMRLLGFLFVFVMFIFSLTFIINDEPALRKGLYWTGVAIMCFFIFYYWMSVTIHFRQKPRQKKQQQKHFQQDFGFKIRQLPRNDGARSRFTA